MKNSGLLLIDKDRGPSSAGVVRAVSRVIGKKIKVGHAGTLDPDATGLLVVLVGATTRLSDFVMDLPKQYEARIRFGVTTDSYDATGAVVAEKDASHITREMVENLLPKFSGTIKQRPPAYSAVKIGGQRSYRLARQGMQTELPERDAIIYEIKLLSFENPDAVVYVKCGKGTYLRTLAFDMGALLEVGAHIHALRRTAIGPFEPNVKVDDLTPENWRDKLTDGARVFEGGPVFRLSGRGSLNLRRGLPIRAEDFLERPTEPVGRMTAVLDETGGLIAVAKIGIGGTLMDRKILDPL